MDFEYTHGGLLTDEEQYVADQGYKWVQTDELQPPDPAGDRKVDVRQLDRQLPHTHHGWSTRLLMAGDLRIEDRGRGRAREDGGPGKRHVVELSMVPGKRREHAMDPGRVYAGSTRRGCRFVEGHRRLTPADAERFTANGTLWLRMPGLDADTDVDTDTICRWLRRARFTPTPTPAPAPLGPWWSGLGLGGGVAGKKEGDRERKKETQVLEFRDEPADEAQRLAQEHIAKWFQDEWRGYEEDWNESMESVLLLLSFHVMAAVASACVGFSTATILSSLLCGQEWRADLPRWIIWIICMCSRVVGLRL